LLKKGWLLLLLLLLFPAGASALLQIGLQNTSVTTIENQPATYYFNMTNTFAFTIYNVSFSGIPEFSFPKVNSLAPNQSVSLSFTVTTQGAFEKDVSSLIIFDYFTKQAAFPKNVTIKVSDGTIDPVTAQLVQGDTALFTNLNETKNYSVFEASNLWSFVLPKSGQVMRQFTNVALEQYKVQLNENSTFIGYVNVSAGQVDTLTHNSLYDERLNFHLKSQHNYSSLKADFLTASFTMNYTETRNGAIFLESGGQPIYNIHLSASPDWVAFDNNDVPVIVDNGVVTYRLRPRITSVNDSGRNYSVAISITSNNAPQINGTIVVWVNNETYVDTTYAELPPSITMVTEAQLKTFCRLFPTACPHQNITIEKVTNITTNETLEIRELKALVERLYHKFDAVDTTVADLGAKVNANQQSISTLTTGMSDLNTEMKKQDKSKLILTWFFIIIIIIAVLVVGGYYGLKFFTEYKQRRNFA
jgi:uncharacterized coiled-coil protein SlyX